MGHKNAFYRYFQHVFSQCNSVKNSCRSEKPRISGVLSDVSLKMFLLLKKKKNSGATPTATKCTTQ